MGKDGLKMQLTGYRLTKAGEQLLLEAESGKQLTITKIVVGDGIQESYSEAKTLVNPIVNVAIESSSVANQVCKISGILTNTALTTGFYIREIGVMGKTDGDEVLIWYATDSDPERFPAYAGEVIVRDEIIINITIGEIDVTINLEDSDGIVQKTYQYKLDAAESATKAKASETNAKTSETNAKTSETNAKTSETNAKTSETNASASEKTATQDLTDVKTAIDNAASGALAATSLVIIDGKYCYVCADDWEAQTEAAR